MISISVLKICSSLFLMLFLGCSTFNSSKGNTWPLPSQPKIKPVKILVVSESQIKDDGYYMDRETAKNLTDNIDALKIYIKKLELLINKMSEYYGDKIEEYKELE